MKRETPKFVNARRGRRMLKDRIVTGAYNGHELIKILFWEDGPRGRAVSIDVSRAEQALSELDQIIRKYRGT